MSADRADPPAQEAAAAAATFVQDELRYWTTLASALWVEPRLRLGPPSASYGLVSRVPFEWLDIGRCDLPGQTNRSPERVVPRVQRSRIPSSPRSRLVRATSHGALQTSA
jgi:hypothetical protein